MTRDEIISMAKKAWDGDAVDQWFPFHAKHFERFSAMIAAHEREECAQIGERNLTLSAWEYVREIRERSE